MRRLQSSLHKMQGLSITSDTQHQVLPVYDIRSLKEMVDLALDLDRSNQMSTMSSTLSSSSSSGSAPSSTETSSSSLKKSCIHHPDATSHTTAECRAAQNRVKTPQAGSASASSSTTAFSPPSSGAGSTVKHDKRGNPIKCFVCGGNHYANDPSCPRHSERVTRSAAGTQKSSPWTSSASSSNSSSSTSSTVASSNTPSTSAPASIRGSAATVTAGNAGSSPSSTISCGSVSLPVSCIDRTLSAAAVIPTQLAVYLMVKCNGRVYSTLVDTGAEISFADAPLVTSWGVPTVQAQQGGKVRLAHADIFTDRSGSAELDVTALFPSSDRKAVQLRCAFELMPIHGPGVDYHFIIGRDLIRVLFPGGLPLAYLPQQTSSTVTVVASSTLVDSLVESSSDAGMLGFIPSDDQPDSIQLFTPDELETQYAAPRQQLLQDLSPFLAVNADITGFCTVPCC